MVRSSLAQGILFEVGLGLRLLKIENEVCGLVVTVFLPPAAGVFAVSANAKGTEGCGAAFML